MMVSIFIEDSSTDFSIDLIIKTKTQSISYCIIYNVKYTHKAPDKKKKNCYKENLSKIEHLDRLQNLAADLFCSFQFLLVSKQTTIQTVAGYCC